ncbi:MAG: hypothetical protein ABEJ72_06725, partial [Candidatus Aenigmatarchaeota archaeon]
VTVQGRVSPSFDSRYGTLIVSGSTSVFVEIKNPFSYRKDNLNVTLSGVRASFGRNGKRFVDSLSIPAGSTRRLRIDVNPRNEGSDRLTVKVIDMGLHVNSTASIPVYTYRQPVSPVSREVPGLGIGQILPLFLTSILFYYLQL